GEFKTVVMVDIPGLIEGAHAGRGMGREFLRHIERCRVVLYLVDVSQPDPEKSYHTLRSELLKYDPVLLEKPSILVLTKCDLLESGTRGVERDLLKIHSRVFAISAVTGEGLEALLVELGKTID
ncbi:MAG: 50S ribosome-binding GTPase, partial [Candidatus Latescibacterota bacterium]